MAQKAMAGIWPVGDASRRRLLITKLKEEGFYLLLVLPVVLVLTGFFVWPIMRILRDSFGEGEFTLRHYERALTTEIYQNMFRTTFELAIITTLGCLVLGYPVAYYLATSTGRRRALVLLMVIIPFITNVIANTYAWRVILGRRGLVNELLQDIWIIDEPLELLFNRFSVSVSMVHTFLPFMILPLYAVMRGIPKSLPAIAESLGASPFQSFRRIFLPLSMPGIWAGGILVFILSAGTIIAPQILGGPRDRGIAFFLGSSGFGAALAILLLVAIMILYLIFARFVGFGPIYSAGEALMRTSAAGSWGRSRPRYLLSAIVTLIGVFLILPVIIVVPLSVNDSKFIYWPPKGFTMRWFANFFTSNDSPFNWIGSTVTSLEIGALVVIFSIPLGGLVAYGLVRGRFPGRSFISSFVMMPLIIPTMITAVALFYFYSNYMRAMFGTVPGIAIPHTILALPYVVIILTATLRSLDVIHEQAAMSLGAGRLITFRRIILPQVVPGILIAAIFAFLVSFNEVVIAIFLKTPFLRTLPMNLWSGVTAEFASMMTAVSTLLLIFAIVVLVAVVFSRSRLNRET